MSLSDRRSFLALLASLPLAGCGFRPVYGPGAPATELRGHVAFRAPETEEGFHLRARLEDRLGRAEQGDYLLVVDLDISEVSLVISSAQDIQRYNLPGIADWALYAAGGEVPLKSGRVQTFTAYSAFGTTVATQEAQRDARDRLAVDLADQIVTHLMIAAQGLE